MDWEVLNAVASAAASMAVVVSVAYLAVQIRNGTKATVSQTYQSATESLAGFAACIGADKDLARLFQTGADDPESLTTGEYQQLIFLGISLFRRYENVFFQYQTGMIDEDFWSGLRDNLFWIFRKPGHQRWWLDRRLYFSQRFRNFLETSSGESTFAENSGRTSTTHETQRMSAMPRSEAPGILKPLFEGTG
jgi:hypothetical protein